MTITRDELVAFLTHGDDDAIDALVTAINTQDGLSEVVADLNEVTPDAAAIAAKVNEIVLALGGSAP